MKLNGKILKIYVRGQSPRSLRSIELINWTGKVFMGHRSHLKQLKEISETSDTGIYFLLNNNEDSGLTEVYIGETDSAAQRITQQNTNQSWWETFVVFISRDLTKSHVRYLEQKMYNLAKQAVSTLTVMNDGAPAGSKLPEPDACAMEEFASNMIFVLESLGLGLFPDSALVEGSKSEQHGNKSDGSISGEFYITLPKDISESAENLKALMTIRNGSIILKAGSPIRKSPRDSFKHHSYFGLWNQIIESNAVKPSKNAHILETVRDLEFKSPSAAAAVVRGGQTNGRTDWRRVSDGKPLFECETEEAA